MARNRRACAIAALRRTRSRSNTRHRRRRGARRLVAGQQHAAAARQMRGSRPLTRSHAVGVERVVRVRRAATATRRRASASRASATRRRWPCDSVRTGRRAGSPGPGAAARVAARRPSAARPCRRARNCSASTTRQVVLQARWRGRCRPAAPWTRLRRRTGIAAPAALAPPSGAASPASRRSRLVLPRPLRPRSQVAAPARTSRSRP